MLKNKYFNFGNTKFKGEAGSETSQTFDISQFVSANRGFTQGVRAPVGEVTIGPQREIAWGFGDVSLDPQNQGRIYIDLKSTASGNPSLKGLIHLVVADNEGDRRETVATYNLEDINSGASNVFERIPLTLMNPNGQGFAGFNDRLIIEFEPTSASGTISQTASKGVIWATRKKTSL